ncbi:unnamed protein product [Paramecium sonneborni]|uniref:Uncharacterized protein n=1 Tax=Paramecium sonneborni TaxID=65129 RepID=A0A8S1LTL3_9CILI|nr:unnamed protein product [Paramecium sonneborni]
MKTLKKLFIVMGICGSKQHIKQQKETNSVIRQISFQRDEVDLSFQRDEIDLSFQRDEVDLQNKKEYECFFFDNHLQRRIKMKYQIEFDKENKITHIYYEQIARLIRNFSYMEPEIFNNLEKIKYLEWVGQYGKNFKKFPEWNVNWNGEFLQRVGGYYSQRGEKIGLWKELSKDYCSKVPLFEEGDYKNNKRTGRWNYIYKDQIMYQINLQFCGHGSYEKGQKNGSWVELWEGFRHGSQIIYDGDYNRNGRRIGKWDIIYCLPFEQEYKQIGGGSYDQQEGQKIGRWIELWEGFSNIAQVTYNGEYNTTGMKVGRWDIMCCLQNEQEQKLIGGGVFKEDGLKIGSWVELWEGYQHDNQITYKGEYNMDGMKVGRWDIMCCLQNEQEQKLIGGGVFKEDGLKIGSWVELWEGYQHDNQITYKGEYNMDGMKVGRWDIMCCLQNEQEQKLIGGGVFKEDGLKIGSWVELWEGYQHDNQITYKGEYNMDGMKVGRWDIMCCLQNEQEQKLIGGGVFKEDGLKIGSWVELWEGYQHDNQITYKGEYNTTGMKEGKWDIMCCLSNEEEIIGGGSYNQNEDLKIGQWTELDQRFSNLNQVTYQGEYNIKGKKVGKWVIWYDRYGFGNYKQIGGGFYDDEKGQKFGKWIELWDKFLFEKEIFYQGEYNMKGVKIGRWNIYYDKYGSLQPKYIGGGLYDKEEGWIKIGRWIEIDEGFQRIKQVTFNGFYNMKGMKVDRWYISLKEDEKHKKIGGGSYCKEGGYKVGKWVELWENFEDQIQITYIGEYNKKGVKVGIWDIRLQKSYGHKIQIYIGCGIYDDKFSNRKIGKWVELDKKFTEINTITYLGQYNMEGKKVGKWVDNKGKQEFIYNI